MKPPVLLFHATYRPYIASIQRWGLGGAPSGPKKNWPDSADGVVYLATRPEIAESYPETAEAVPEDWCDHIAIFRVDMRRLDKALLQQDQNVQADGEASTFEYHGVIPPEALELLTQEQLERIAQLP